MKQRQHHSIEAEQSVLGGVMFRPDVLRRLDALEASDFRHPKHEAIWSAILACQVKSTPIDVVSVGDALQTAGKLEMAGGAAYLGELTLRCPSPDNVEHYARIVMRHRVTRDLRIKCGEIIAALDSMDNDGDEQCEGEAAVQWAIRQLGEIKTRESGAEITVGELVCQRMASIASSWDDRIAGRITLTGLPTGIDNLDDKLGGYPRGVITIVAGRPGMGKSSVMRAAADACSKLGLGSHTFSLEDTRDAYGDRVISTESQVPAQTIRRAELNRGELSDLQAGVARLRSRKGWLVDDRSGLRADDVVRSWRRAAEKNATQIVIVDYLQRLRKRDPRQSMHDHLGECMTVLADAAKQDKIAVVVGCQLNRGVEQRDDKRPMLSDLRESGYIEELAKAVLGCYRPAYYHATPVRGVDYDEDEPPPSDFDSLLSLLVLKNSNGETGCYVRATWHGPTISVR